MDHIPAAYPNEPNLDSTNVTYLPREGSSIYIRRNAAARHESLTYTYINPAFQIPVILPLTHMEYEEIGASRLSLGR